MKRCPQCLFIYPDSDARCDFDNTPLVVVDEAELAAATDQTPKQTKQKRATKKSATKKRSRKTTVLTALIGLVLGISAFVVYSRFTHRSQVQATIPIARAQPLAIPVTSPPVPETASPSPTPAPIPKPTSERIATAHTSTTVAPVSTSGPGMGKNGKPIILLSSGGKIDADEVWRTRDGVWYRRDGIVTLLKRGRVKAIVNQ